MEELGLPDKWCIKNNIKYNNIISSWFENKLGRIIIFNSESYFHYPEFKTCMCTSSSIEPGYITISFDNFKKYVLKLDRKDISINTDTSYLIEILNKYNIT